MRNKLLPRFLTALFILAAFFVLNYKGGGKIVIAVDPGHGGSKISEKGYISATGVLECTLNNAVAAELEKILVKRGYKVVFTKPPQDDVFSALQNRPETANEIKADLLVSIHHDANKNTAGRGCGIYYSSYRVNLDDKDIFVLYNGREYPLASERVVSSGNGGSYSAMTLKDGASSFEINNIDNDYTVIDKTPCAAALDSLRLAEILYGRMLQLDYIQPKGTPGETVTDEEFRVLRYSDMPSVLIEAGYMTNPAELAEIQKSENQKKLALAIADAIDEFFGK